MANRKNARLRDNTLQLATRRVLRWRRIILILLRRCLLSPEETSHTLQKAFRFYVTCRRNFSAHLHRRNRIASSRFPFNFNAFSDEDYLSYFRFKTADIIRLVPIIELRLTETATKPNSFRVTPLHSKYVLLRRTATPCRWRDVETMFAKHSSHLSEIFWETVEGFLEARQHLLTSPLVPSLFEEKASMFAEAIKEKSQALNNCVGFIDDKVIGVPRPAKNELQRVLYNGHKRKRALKYQALVTPDGIFVHVSSPLEERRHDWNL